MTPEESRASRKTLLLGFGRRMMELPLSGLKDAIKADYAVRSFRQALAIILKTATEQNSGEDNYAKSICNFRPHA